MLKYSFGFGVLAAFGLLAAALPAQAQDDHHGQCVAIGVELGDRSAAAQEELDKLNDLDGELTADQQAEVDELQELLDNLDTISASMAVLYDAEATPPSEDELETVHGAEIEDLLDAAKECIDNA